ncbi:MAG: YihY/virulence factor BrkB family protein [Bacilli bacterium]|nr:YihY/virulence factor BrkB family protein [Bacilli bacterium]
MIKKLREYIKKIITIVRKPVMSILPGQLAFSFVLTIIPVIALIAIIATTFSISLNSITSFISTSFPKAVSDMLLPLITGRGFDFSVFVFLIAAIWLASTGAYAVITAADVVYDIKQERTIKKRVKSIVMVIFMLLLILFMLLIPAFGDFIFDFIANLKIFSHMKGEILTIYYLLKYPISFIYIYVTLKIIYTIAPSKDIQSKSVTRGSLFTTIMWMITTQIYSYYVGNIVNYDIFYGSISNIIILLTWVYFLAYVFTIGLIINAGTDENNMQVEKK